MYTVCSDHPSVVTGSSFRTEGSRHFAADSPAEAAKRIAEPQGGGVSPPANSLQMQAKLGSGRYRTKVAAGCKSAAKAASGRRKAAGRAAREERQMTLLVTPRSATTSGRGVFGGMR